MPVPGAADGQILRAGFGAHAQAGGASLPGAGGGAFAPFGCGAIGLPAGPGSPGVIEPPLARSEQLLLRRRCGIGHGQAQVLVRAPGGHAPAGRAVEET